jgi:hypothetical protein
MRWCRPCDRNGSTRHWRRIGLRHRHGAAKPDELDVPAPVGRGTQPSELPPAAEMSTPRATRRDPCGSTPGCPGNLAPVCVPVKPARACVPQIALRPPVLHGGQLLANVAVMEHLVHAGEPQLTVRFESRFVEKLIDGAIIRKFGKRSLEPEILQA